MRIHMSQHSKENYVACTICGLNSEAASKQAHKLCP